MINYNNDKVIEVDLLEAIYPIGSIYMSVNNVSPSALFGGTWEQIQDTFLLAAGSTFTAGDTGGAINHTPSGSLSGGSVGNHTLTVAEMPSHSHSRTVIVYNFDNDGELARNDSNGDSLLAQDNKGASSAGTAPWTNKNLGNGNNTGGGGAHNHPFTQPTFTGTSQNTMPPYLTVYIWKRVS